MEKALRVSAIAAILGMLAACDSTTDMQRAGIGAAAGAGVAAVAGTSIATGALVGTAAGALADDAAALFY